jgi:two-component system sensor histidine kinase KdpD
VFLGAAPGVGKTYAMLQAAHAQLRQGVQVMAGVVETHGRAETEALLGGLPQQPLLRSGTVASCSKKWTSTACSRPSPGWCWSTNWPTATPPAAAAKRWQDVQELLAAGIDVYTTVNVQHLESLNDRCATSPACRCAKPCRTGCCRKPSNWC